MSIWGVGVSIIEPGGVHTSIQDLFAPLNTKQFKSLSPELQEQYGEEYLDKGRIVVKSR